MSQNFLPRLLCLTAWLILPCLLQAQEPLQEAVSKALVQIQKQKEQSRKISSDLATLNSRNLDSRWNDQMMIYDGWVRIIAQPSGTPEILQKDLEELGAKNTRTTHGVVCALFPVAKVNRLEELESLRFVRPEFKPIAYSGSVTSEGDVSLRADLARATYNVDGAGIRIGILSDSYDALGGAAAGIASGDLPGPGNPNGFTQEVVVLSEIEFPDIGSDEGRAMAEIVHDVAPGAEIFFYSAFNGYFDFAEGIRALAEAGCDLIVDDILYLVEPYFQDGSIAQAVDEVTEQGVSYFSSAGNIDRNSYESAFHPIELNGHTFQDFGDGNIFLTFTLDTGQITNLWFQWDDPTLFAAPNNLDDPGQIYEGPCPDTDMDVLIFDANTGEFLNPIFGGNFDNLAFCDNYEVVSVQNTTGIVQEIAIAINRFAGPNPEVIKFIDFGSSVPPNEVNSSPGGTCVGHANAAGAVAVGASAYFNTEEFGDRPALINFFSSVGGVPLYLNADGSRKAHPEVREKPLITGPDGGNNTFFGGDAESDGLPNFFGTSASAPHVAAVAALMLEAHPSLSPEEMKEILIQTAVDMDDPATLELDEGFDFKTGYGFVQADAAVAAVQPSPSVYRFELVNAVANRVISTIREGDTISMVDPVEPTKVNIVAKVSPGTQEAPSSVKFDLSGDQSFSFTDSNAPFALFGDVNGNFNAWRAKEGQFTLSAAVGSSADSISFFLTDQLPGIDFAIVDADNDLLVGPLEDTLDLALAPSALNIEYLPEGGFFAFNNFFIDKVEFNLEGAGSNRRTENLAPYALYGDQEGDYHPWEGQGPATGKYTLSAKEYNLLPGVPPVTYVFADFEVVNTAAPSLALRSGSDAGYRSLYTERLYVYPNPTSDGNLNLHWQSEKRDEPVTISIYSLTGQQLKRFRDMGSIHRQIDLSGLPSGTYTVQVVSGSSMENRQIVVR